MSTQRILTYVWQYSICQCEAAVTVRLRSRYDQAAVTVQLSSRYDQAAVTVRLSSRYDQASANITCLIKCSWSPPITLASSEFGCASESPTQVHGAWHWTCPMNCPGGRPALASAAGGRVLCEKPEVSQWSTNFPPNYTTRQIISIVTTARHLPLSWARSIPSWFLKTRRHVQH